MVTFVLQWVAKYTCQVEYVALLIPNIGGGVKSFAHVSYCTRKWHFIEMFTGIVHGSLDGKDSLFRE